MDKVVILARGLGLRLRREDPDARLSADQAAVAAAGIKALMPIDRPFLDYVLSALAEAGYRRICLVIGPEHGALRRYYGKELDYQQLKVEFAVQEQPLGTADAVTAASKFVGDDPFLMINSDNHYPVEALEAVRRLDGPGLPVFERERGQKGRLSVQTSPKLFRSRDAMLAQALHFDKLAPNIQVKLPATRIGIEVIEEASSL